MDFPFFKKNKHVNLEPVAQENIVKTDSHLINFKNTLHRFFQNRKNVINRYDKTNSFVSWPLFWTGTLILPFFIVLKPLIFFCFFIGFSIIAEKVIEYKKHRRLKQMEQEFLYTIKQQFKSKEEQYQFLHELSLYKKNIPETIFDIIQDQMTSYFIDGASFSADSFVTVYNNLQMLDNSVILENKKSVFFNDYETYLESANLLSKEANGSEPSTKKSDPIDFKKIL